MNIAEKVIAAAATWVLFDLICSLVVVVAFAVGTAIGVL